MSTRYTIGFICGTNSVRALVINATNGGEVALLDKHFLYKPGSKAYYGQK